MIGEGIGFIIKGNYRKGRIRREGCNLFFVNRLNVILIGGV
jgi:hypothetical protein